MRKKTFAIGFVLVFAACGEGPLSTLDGSVEPADAAEGTPDGGPDAAPAADAAPPDAEPLQYDCDDLPKGPFNLKPLVGPVASEDLAFDAEGNLVGSDDTTIFKSPYSGSPVPFVPSFEFRAGLRFTPYELRVARRG